jgi:hypothetical protein
VGPRAVLDAVVKRKILTFTPNIKLKHGISELVKKYASWLINSLADARYISGKYFNMSLLT